MLNFIEALQVLMKRREGDVVLDLFMKHHECLNHLPMSAMHSIAEEGKTPKFILEI